MKLYEILKECCMLCECFNPETSTCGDTKKIDNPILHSCSFSGVSEKFETMEDVKKVIETYYNKPFEEIEVWGKDHVG